MWGLNLHPWSPDKPSKTQNVKICFDCCGVGNLGSSIVAAQQTSQNRMFYKTKMADTRGTGIFWASSSASSWRARALFGARNEPGPFSLMMAWIAYIVETLLAFTLGFACFGWIAAFCGDMDDYSSLFGGFITLWSWVPSMVGYTMDSFWVTPFDLVGYLMQGFRMDDGATTTVSGMEILMWELPVVVLCSVLLAWLIWGLWMGKQFGHIGFVGDRQLHGVLRGGAGGSDVTERKRHLTNLVSKLVSIIEKMAENEEQEIDDRPDNHQAVFLREFSRLVQQWEVTTPTCGELQKALAGLISQDLVHHERAKRNPSTAGQSFYQQFLKEKQERRHSKSSGGKGSGKSKPGAKGKGPSAPKFDMSKICPQKNLISRQRLESLLEKGEAGSDTTLNNAVCVLDSYYRMLELQNMAEAHGATLKTLLISRIDSEEFDKEDGGKCEMLPFLGNLALMRARFTCLDRPEPSLKGVTPARSEAPGLSEEDKVSLRIIAPLSLIEDPKTKDYLLKHPEYTLKLLKCPLKEVKTNSWTGNKGTIEGYLIIPSSQAEVVLQLSGTGGIFTQGLRKDVLLLPEVNWFPQESGESDIAYFRRVAAVASERSLPLTYRSGGGAWIGIQDPAASSNLKTWAINGIPDTWGPKTVMQWLQSVNWEIQGQPSPPRSGKQGWQIHAKHPKDDSREHYGYELQIGGVTRNILVKRWQKHRSVEQGSKITGPKWWSADFIENDPIEVFDTQPIPPTILDDTQMEASGENNGENGKTKPEHTSGESPEKKRVKLWKEPRAAPNGKWLGGRGARGLCGWRVVSYMVAMQTSWQAEWCPDPLASESTESGPVTSGQKPFRLQAFSEETQKKMAMWPQPGGDCHSTKDFSRGFWGQR